MLKKIAHGVFAGCLLAAGLVALESRRDRAPEFCREGCGICVMHVPRGGCPAGWTAKLEVFYKNGVPDAGCVKLGPGEFRPDHGLARANFCFDHLEKMEVIR
jgi:hypothetical protein